ncbi:hypothetical protein WICPIJ_007836 [Wickerhamomyces pijperi]|uniref:Iron-sulfur assembly protein 1 n=1 Tax=Wickerhamomyces pijperi TaxID=599730 RepID=A0A9P8TK24_WICPI|nr:hypothetical protein WICPIJ_007836 [Wickerhamomyces pijperi]
MMIRIPFANRSIINNSLLVRSLSTNSNSTKRFLQTGGIATSSTAKDYVPYKFNTSAADSTIQQNTGSTGSSWAKHTLSSRSFGDVVKSSKSKSTPVKEEAKTTFAPSSATQTETQTISTTATPAPKKRRRTLKPRKALITLSQNAIIHLRGLLDQPEPKMIRIGVKNRGCSGLTYNLEYITEPHKFDEIVEQDGVKVIIDSKALFSIVGSEMDWLDDKLSSRFIFRNPNSKGTCGCGESFMV